MLRIKSLTVSVHYCDYRKIVQDRVYKSESFSTMDAAPESHLVSPDTVRLLQRRVVLFGLLLRKHNSLLIISKNKPIP